VAHAHAQRTSFRGRRAGDELAGRQTA
jgi:hypothetical protein